MKTKFKPMSFTWKELDKESQQEIIDQFGDKKSFYFDCSNKICNTNSEAKFQKNLAGVWFVKNIMELPL